ncbi:MAG: HNH endonuclease [Acidobacteria bacterium]|nr:HNH endonuclease [Acidobacteriota bacterium]
MPSSPLRYCAQPGCGERVKGGYCAKHSAAHHRRRDEHRGNSTQRGYDAGWRKLAALVLAESPLCVDCLANGRSVPASEVHHVERLRDAPARRLDPSNLMALCKPCHSRRTARGE